MRKKTVYLPVQLPFSGFSYFHVDSHSDQAYFFCLRSFFQHFVCCVSSDEFFQLQVSKKSKFYLLFKDIFLSYVFQINSPFTFNFKVLLCVPNCIFYKKKSVVKLIFGYFYKKMPVSQMLLKFLSVLLSNSTILYFDVIFFKYLGVH